MKRRWSRFHPLLVLMLFSSVAHAAMPDILPYGLDNLPVPPSPRKNATPPKVVDLLGAQLNDPYSLTRVRLLAEIGACELPAGAKYIRIGLGDADPLVRAQAARSAAMLGEASLAEDLKKLQNDTDPRVRQAVVTAASALGADAIVSAGLNDSSADVKAAAVAAARAAQAGELAKALSSYPPALQVVAIRSLGRVGGADTAGAIAPFLASESVPARVAAAEAIGRLKASAHTAALEKLLADPHATARRAALASLHNLLATGDFQKRAIAALNDPDLSVRENAARLLEKSPTPDAIDALAANLPSESARLHDAARLALVAIGQPAVPRAQQLLDDASPRRREDGSFILGRLKSDAGFDKHVALLADADWAVVKQAANSLGNIGRKDAAPEMAKLAQRAADHATVPLEQMPDAIGAMEQTIVACAYFDERSIVPLCRKLLPGKLTVPAQLRCAAAYAVGRMDTADGPMPGAINRIINDQEDAGDVKLEGLKALGHMKAKAATSQVGTSRETAKFVGDHRGDWLAHWVRFKLTGKEEPYEPLPNTWTAPVSITVFE